MCYSHDNSKYTHSKCDAPYTQDENLEFICVIVLGRASIQKEIGELESAKQKYKYI